MTFRRLSSLRALMVSLRPYHWMKNVLVFLPLFFAERITCWGDVLLSFRAFLCFCLAASSIYLINDSMDLSQDKFHPLKKMRPLASGLVSIPLAAGLACLFLIVSLGTAAFFINRSFLIVIFVYVVLGIAYSKYLKHWVIVDVLTLSAFYILRILGGLVAIEARISYWMILCIGLLAMFIGFNKRRHEIKFIGRKEAGLHRGVLHQYRKYTIDQMVSVVTAATPISYTLYTVDPETIGRFGTHALVLTVPFVYYGVFRYLYIVHRKGKGGDPVRIFFSDFPTILNACLWFLTCLAVIYWSKAK